MEYEPKPIDTESVILCNALLDLTERLAENSHDNWAIGRIKEGWVYGEKRDDALKHHPCLVPYADLPDSEKEYDRVSAMETLKAIKALGFEIEPILIATDTAG